MSGANQDQPEIRQLWPTQMLRHRLPGAERANPVLVKLLTELDEGKAEFTTDYLSGNLFDHEHPVIGWLKSCVNRAVVDYARAAGVDYELDFYLQAWGNVNRFGDYHNLHNHPHAWLSGTYYVQAPEPKALPGRSDGDPQVDPEHRILPQAGEILVWPAFLHHLVHPNLSDELRVSISFNVVLRMRREYLP